jgi:uncharacterized membrane protein YidH (DUF202 family)
MNTEDPKTGQGRRDPVPWQAERSLLAWVRTCIAVVALGLVLVRVDLLAGAHGTPLGGGLGGRSPGLMLCWLGALVCAAAGARYVWLLREHRKGQVAVPGLYFPTALAFAVALGAAGLALLLSR